MSITRQRAASARNARIPAAFFFAAAFLVIAPLSLATQLEAAPTLKYVRVGLCMIGVLVGMAGGASGRIQAAAGSLIAFALFYTIAPIWSPYPLNGVIYKTVFLSALLLGIFVGASWRSADELRKGLRLLGIVASGASSLVLYQYLKSPSEMSQVGRLAAYGINANAIGMTAAGYFLITLFLAVNERGVWRWLGMGGSGVLLLVLIATGSRSSMAMALLGGAIQFIPWMKRPGRVLAATIPLAVIILLFSEGIDTTAIERFGSTENTRSGMWQAGLRLFHGSPVIGHGWLSQGRSTNNLQNVYFQILAETGIVGGALFVAAGIGMLNTIRRIYPQLEQSQRPAFFMALSVLTALAVHGIAESALILGSTAITMLFGMALGMFQGMLEVKRQMQRNTSRVPASSRWNVAISRLPTHAHPARHS